MSGRLLLLATTHRVAPGLLTWPAWRELRAAAAVRVGDPAHPQLPYLREAGVAAEVIDGPPGGVARELLALVESAGGTVLWLGAPEGDEVLLREIGMLAVTAAPGTAEPGTAEPGTAEPGTADPGAAEPGPGMAEPSAPGSPEIEVLHGSYDLPGARLLDLVATMDALRTNCPWDREQTHETLAKYLIEEAYEAIEAIETGDQAALREELGDVLLQVAFHARLAEERTDGTGFTIDDVAAGIVDKLVRRHPHVFGGAEVSGKDDVRANWETIKAAERAAKNGGTDDSMLGGVPFAQPAVLLAYALQKRAVRNGVPEDLTGDDGGPGGELFGAVARERQAGTDPEMDLRAAARRFRDRVHRVADDVRAEGGDPRALTADDWRARLSSD